MDFTNRIFERTYGVEIECVAPAGLRPSQAAHDLTALGVPCIDAGGYSHARTTQWKITTDRTITSNTSIAFDRGWEFVSPHNPALKGEDGFAQIAKLCTYLRSKGFAVNRNCGLHVHIDVNRPRALTMPAMRRLAMLYAENEVHILDRMVPPSRRGNGNMWCRSIANHVTVRALESAQDMYQLSEIIATGRVQHSGRGRFGRSGSRFVKLNIGSHWLYGTTEFRQFAGTTEASKITYWIMLCLRLVDTAEHSSTAAVAAPVARTLAMARRGTKRALVIELMLRPEGTTQAECLAVSGWRAINLVRMAKEYGLTLRTESTRVDGRRVTRYFAHRETPEERAARLARTADTVTAPTSMRAQDLDDFSARLGMSDDEKEFWRQRVAFLAGAA